MATPSSPVGNGDLSSAPPQPPSGQPPSPPASMSSVTPAAGLSAAAFPQEVMQTVSLVKDSLTHLVALLPPLAPFVAQSLDQLMQMTQAIVQQSSSGPPQAQPGGGGAQPQAMMPPQGAGTPPPGA